MSKKYKFVLAIVFHASTTLNVSADTCTLPPTAVDPSMTSEVTFDSKTQSYKYRYSIKNGPNAQISLDFFGIYSEQAPSKTETPKNWISEYITNRASWPSYQVWLTHAINPAEANLVTNDGTLSEHIYALKSGQQLGGFEISSPRPPGVVQFFAQGFTQLPSTTATELNDEPEPKCPGWDFNNSKIQKQVTGAVTGPSDPNIQSIRIRAREMKGEGRSLPINPKGPTGKMAVLVFSSRDFDASQMDLSTVVFGPAYAKPIDSKLIPTGVGEKIGEDERLDWEIALERLRPEEADRKNVFPKNILLVFDVASLDVQCNLDRSIFLRGKTKAGASFIGAVPAKTAGCDKKDIGVHRNHPYPYKWWKHDKTAGK